jgi:hypothetical protein
MKSYVSTSPRAAVARTIRLVRRLRLLHAPDERRVILRVAEELIERGHVVNAVVPLEELLVQLERSEEVLLPE